MGLLSKIATVLRSVPSPVGAAAGGVWGPGFFTGALGTARGGEGAGSYVTSAPVMAAVKFVSDPIAGAALRFTEDADAGRSQRAVNAPALAAFWASPAVGPLGPMHGAEFVTAIAQSLLLKGRAPIFLDFDWTLNTAPERKSKLQLLDPDRLRPLKGKDPATGNETLEAWSYRRADGSERVIASDQVVFIRLPHPYDPFSGASPMLSAQIAADADVLGGQQAKATAKNNGRLSPIVSTRSGAVLTPEQRDQVKTALRSARDRAAAGQVDYVFLPADIVLTEPTPEGLSGEFVSARTLNREEIFLAFGVPLSKASNTPGNSIRSSSDEYHLVWNTCAPLGARMADPFARISMRFLNRPTTNPLYGYFDFSGNPAVQAAQRDKLADAVRLCAVGMPYRTADMLLDIGAPEFPGDTVGFLPFNVQTMADALATTPAEKNVTPALPAKSAADPFDAMRTLLSAPRAALPEPTRADPPAEDDAEEKRRAKLWRMHAARRRPAEKLFEGKVTKCLAAARGEVLGKLDKLGKRAAAGTVQRGGPTPTPAATFGDATAVVFDPTAFEDALATALEKAQRSTFDVAGREVWADIGRPDDAWQMPMGQAINALRDRENLIRNAGQEIFEEIRTELETGFIAGETTDQLADRVRAKFNEIGKGRANTIAVTETGAAYGAGQHAAQTQAGVKQKEWLSARDARVRPDHRAADGQVVALDGLFTVGGERTSYPCGEGLSANQACGCRCISISVLED